MIHYKEALSGSTARKGTTDAFDSEEVAGVDDEEIRLRNIEKKTADKSKTKGECCLIMSTSLVVITIICFITGSYLAVRTKTITDIISLAGR